jgi:hypothetical protein
MSALKKVLQRKREQGSVPKLTEERVAKIRQFFAAFPFYQDVYLFHDGHIEGGEAFRKRLTSRTAQLVSISTDGIPVCISRTHSQIEEP